MADVFKGRVQGPAGFERVFVVKRILPHLSDDPQFTRMFIEEAKLSARLNHPNVVQVFELGAVDKEYFIAMEYVKGRDLAETMRTLWARVGPPRPELVAYIGREMCRALAYAHDLTGDEGEHLGMIHRDVSPSNVMLSYEGAVKLLDFGIAKALGADGKEEGGTQRGTLKGKFAYMAPEQTQGNDVDRRIDIFATGIVLHEILTGRRLFKGENDLQTVERVRQCEVAPPSLQNPLCPPELDAIVLRALARDREERFQTASDLADALDDVVHAARFQPTHLAMLMRELFPSDAGGHGRVGSTMSGTQSRPHSAAMRSPTIPPISMTRQPSRTSLPRVEAAPPPPPPRPFLARGTTWGALALLAVGGGLGALAVRGGATPAPMSATADRTPVPRKFSTAVQSIPDGAKIYLLGENKLLGTTDAYVTFEQKSDARISIVLKKEGYKDEVREVTPYPMMIQLKAVEDGWKPGRGGRRPIEPRAPAAAPGPGSGVGAGSAPVGALSPSAPANIVPTPPPERAPATTATSNPAVSPPPVAQPALPVLEAPQRPASTPPRERPASRGRRPQDPNQLVSPF